MKSKQTPLNMSIEALEGNKWPEPPEDSSPLILECHRLRKVPIGNLTIEGLRMLLGQGIGVNYLVPLALDKLEEDPWAEGMHFEGDLLLNTLRVAPDYWSANPTQLERLTDVMDALEEKVKFFLHDLQPTWQKLFAV